MWQPNTAQWRVIWIVAVLLILSWPPEKGRSLAIKEAKLFGTVNVAVLLPALAASAGFSAIINRVASMPFRFGMATSTTATSTARP